MNEKCILKSYFFQKISKASIILIVKFNKEGLLKLFNKISISFEIKYKYRVLLSQENSNTVK